MRLQAFLARAGAAPSRRKAEDFIRSGRVTVNGNLATLGESASPGDEVYLDGRPVNLPTGLAYLALNKPSGVLTTMRDERGRPTVAALMPSVPGLVPVGRLDADTTGLLLLTNDGAFANRIAHPSSEIQKEYQLTVKNPIPKEALGELSEGPTLEDGEMLPPRISNLTRQKHTTTLNLTIHEGRNRIIRRACAAVGLDLISLKRVRVGLVELGSLPEGRHRSLTHAEIAGLTA
jgi:23S rRNA pseudouridine2605 synthase